MHTIIPGMINATQGDYALWRDGRLRSSQRPRAVCFQPHRFSGWTRRPRSMRPRRVFRPKGTLKGRSAAIAMRSARNCQIWATKVAIRHGNRPVRRQSSWHDEARLLEGRAMHARTDVPWRYLNQGGMARMNPRCASVSGSAADSAPSVNGPTTDRDSRGGLRYFRVISHEVLFRDIGQHNSCSFSGEQVINRLVLLCGGCLRDRLVPFFGYGKFGVHVKNHPRKDGFFVPRRFWPK